MDDVELEAALTEAHAPVDEPATSADELDEDDEAVCLLSSLSSLHAGAWVVLHSLVRKPELNGTVGVLIGQNEGDADRWDCHMLLEGRAIAVRTDSLSVVAPCTWKLAGLKKVKSTPITSSGTMNLNTLTRLLALAKVFTLR